MRVGILSRATCRRLILLLSTGVAACGEQPALTPPPPRPAAADLSPAIQQQLTQALDLRAAYQFFHSMSQADADHVLADMGFYAGQAPTETEHVRIPIQSTNPTIQDVLNRMWAPYWKQLPRSALHDATLPYPGRPVAATAAHPAEQTVHP